MRLTVSWVNIDITSNGGKKRRIVTVALVLIATLVGSFQVLKTDPGRMESHRSPRSSENPKHSAQRSSRGAERKTVFFFAFAHQVRAQLHGKDAAKILAAWAGKSLVHPLNHRSLKP
jgi:hypothetical protein